MPLSQSISKLPVFLHTLGGGGGGGGGAGGVDGKGKYILNF